MASTPQGTFFASLGGTPTPNNKKKPETFKLPENPLLSQRLAATTTTPSRNDNALVLQSSTNELRQRRPLQDQQQQALAKPSSSFKPPKASLSLRTSNKSIPLDQARSQIVVRRSNDDAILPSNSGCWVLVYGIDTQAHFDLCKDYFGKLGNVIATRGSFVPGKQNWFAVQYASPLQAEKANLQRDVQLEPGFFCGVRRLEDNDPLLMQSSASIGLNQLWGDSSVKRLPPLDVTTITENDLFLGSKEDNDLPKKRNCFDRFICWILHLDD